MFLSVALLQYHGILTHAGINLPREIKEELKGHREADPLKDKQTGVCAGNKQKACMQRAWHVQSQKFPSILWDLQNYSSKV